MRGRQGGYSDPFISDTSIYLERKISDNNNETRTSRIARYGRGMLIDYVDKTQVVFVTGNLPQAIAPSKIYSCHDIVTAAELRGSINKLATT